MRVLMLMTMIAAAVVMEAQSPPSDYRPKPVALLAEEVEIYVGAGGRERGRVEKLIAIRSDGARVELRRQDSHTTRLIVDPFRARRVVVHGAARAITVYPLGWHEVNVLRAESRDPGCGIAPDRAVPVTMLGFPALRSPVIGGGVESGMLLRRQVVRSPELGCLELRSVVSMPNPDGTRSVTIREVRSIQLGEPPPALFDPPDWPEVSPAELERRSRGQQQ